MKFNLINHTSLMVMFSAALAVATQTPPIIPAKVAPTRLSTSVAYPGKKTELCFTEFTAVEKKRGLINVVIDTYQASLLKPDAAESLWDPEFLKANNNYKIALDEYVNGKRGQKIKSLDLHHKSAEEIHTILINNGFKHKRVPLKVRKSVTRDRGYYWLTNGEMTSDANHADLVIMDIYIHDDGSMVRVKPESTPDQKRRTNLRFPHYSKNVILNTQDVCDAKNVCQKDLSYSNEAFKLTREGNPLPKSVKAESGFRFLYSKNNKRKRAMQADVVMNLIHFNLPTQCLRKADWLDNPDEVDDKVDAYETSENAKDKVISTKQGDQKKVAGTIKKRSKHKAISKPASPTH